MSVRVAVVLRSTMLRPYDTISTVSLGQKYCQCRPLSLDVDPISKLLHNDGTLFRAASN